MKKMKKRNKSQFIAKSGLPGISTVISILICLMVSFFIVWSFIFKINIYETAIGKVNYADRIHRIEAATGGIVEKVYVGSGQNVKSGQKLFTIVNEEVANRFKADSYKVADYRAQLARLKAILEESSLKIPVDIVKEYPILAANQISQYTENVSSLNEAKKILDQKQKLFKQELQMVKPLVEKGVLAKIEQIKLEHKINEIKSRRADLVNQNRQSSAEQQAKLMTKLKTLQQTMKTTAAQMTQKVVKAPISGVVHDVKVSKVGDVVARGDLLMDILPISDGLTITLKVPPSKIGFIKKTMPVSIRVDAYEYAVYGDLKGVVTNISSDSIEEANGSKYFEVKIKAQNSFIENRGKLYQVKPGMTVTANIKINNMRLITYIFKPFIKSFVEGFT